MAPYHTADKLGPFGAILLLRNKDDSDAPCDEA